MQLIDKIELKNNKWIPDKAACFKAGESSVEKTNINKGISVKINYKIK